MTGCGNSQMRTMMQNGEQKAAVMNRPVQLKLDYLLYLPHDYDPQTARPLVIFLHGIGERGNDPELVTANGLPKLIRQGRQFDFIVASPQCPADKWWVGMDSYVVALIDEVAQSYSVDRERVYLTGLSMGGYGTWSAAAGCPERFAAIAPVCGGGRPIWAGNLKDVPVWAFHGAKDKVVPLSESQQMVDAVNRHGGSARLTVYPEAGHDAWSQAYDDPELYTWLLSHRKRQ